MRTEGTVVVWNCHLMMRSVMGFISIQIQMLKVMPHPVLNWFPLPPVLTSGGTVAGEPPTFTGCLGFGVVAGFGGMSLGLEGNNHMRYQI